MKAYQLSIKQSTQKRYKKEGPNSKQNEETTKGMDCKGNINKACTQTPTPLRPPHSQGAYQIMRREEQLKEHLA